MTKEKEIQVKEELRVLINRHSLENDSNTPDFLLAEVMLQCLKSYNSVIQNRDKWFGIDVWEVVANNNQK